jgi:hypothetical protein
MEERADSALAIGAACTLQVIRASAFECPRGVTSDMEAMRACASVALVFDFVFDLARLDWLTADGAQGAVTVTTPNARRVDGGKMSVLDVRSREAAQFVFESCKRHKKNHTRW